MIVARLLISARQAGLTLDRGPQGTLVVRGPRSAGALVEQILSRKEAVLSVVDVYNGRAEVLSWRGARVAEKAGRCVICNRWALLRDPWDDRPMHKVCVESSIRPALDATGSAA